MSGAVRSSKAPFNALTELAAGVLKTARASLPERHGLIVVAINEDGIGIGATDNLCREAVMHALIVAAEGVVESIPEAECEHDPTRH